MVLGAILSGIAVLLGAFGAHGLQSVLLTNNRADTFETAVRYHFYHAFAILIIGLLMNEYSNLWLGRASWLMAVGILLFSGSLYTLSLTNITILGAITPFGGVCFIIGWALLVLGILQKN